MAETLLSFGVQKLCDLLARESVRLQGFQKQFDELKRDLNLLRLFLKDADSKKHTNEMVKTCVEEIKEIVFDAEDLIETFLLKKALGKTSIRKRMRRLSCIIVDRMKIVSDMGGIRERISKVICNMHSFGVQQITVDGGEFSHPLQERQREMRKTFPSNNENDLVGLEENVKKLVGYLVEEDSIQVVSITGMGGIGKTTLAQQVFNHEMVKNHFDGVAWVCISQKCERTYVWKTIMQQLSSKHDEQRDTNMTEEVLHKKILRLLETSNSLIVLDDIWNEEDWDRIKSVFPSKKGWKILFTSRNENVALRAYHTCVTFKSECLTPDETWTLFRRIAFPRKDTTADIEVDVEMEEMGKQMIKHCGGLPLAVKVLGGLLAAQHSLSDWKRISENIKSHIVGGTSFNDRNMSSVYHILSLSFEELPSYLKHCFLYLAHFPEDHKIEVMKLYYYWAAEGIFEPRPYDGETIQDVGDVYIAELVRRNMVISQREATTLRFRTCHLHDMMREICLLKAKEENFLQITSSRPPTASFQSPATPRRFVSQYPTTLHVERDINSPKLRSLVVVVQGTGSWGGRWELSGSSYTRLELLRVLHLCKAKFSGRKLASGIGKLIHLRYLSLEKAMVYHIPSSLRNLKLLIYLNLNIDISEYTLVPNVLMGMQELRYLALPRLTHKKSNLELSNLVKLEALKNFSTRNSSVEDLRGMVRLRTLTIISNEETSMETLSASIGGLRHLEYLSITDWLSSRGYKRRTEEVEEVVLDFNHLRKLKLSIYMPRQQHFPSRLTLLYLSHCCFEEDPMPILEKLVLLKELRLGFRSFSGRRMVCSSGGFPQLQELSIHELAEWEEWIVEEGSMPLLHTLVIWDCRKLKELPDGLRFISSLKNLIVPREWEERVSVGGEDYDKVKHIPSVKFR